MSTTEKLFFRVMISGYRAVSTVFPRYRFARRWNLQTTTVDRCDLEHQLAGCGFVARNALAGEGQLLLHHVNDQVA